MTQNAYCFSDWLKAITALFCTVSVAFADSNRTVSIELCRADSARVDIEVPAGTTLAHGLSGDAKSYFVILQAAATIHAYVDCVDVDAGTSSSDTKTNDELHLSPNANPSLAIKGNVIRPATSTGAKRESGEKPKLTDRINWPN